MIPFVIDVDHVLSDGVYYPSLGRKYNLRDGFGIALLKQLTNIEPIMMSGEDDESISKRAEKLGVPFRSATNKRKLLNNWYSCQNECVYIAISDDISDKELLQQATIAFCPADAENEIKTLVNYHDGGIVLSKNGGQGCVREAINMLLNDEWLQSKLPTLNIRDAQQRE